MTKPFPPPPFKNPRNSEPTEAPAPSPFGPPTPDHIIEDDPRLSDESVILAFKQYLRPDQHREEIYRFILSYMTNRNAAQAARESGLPPHSGSYYRSKPEIHSCIEALTAMAVMKHGYDANEVIERAKEIAVVDPVVLQNPDGSYKTRLSDIPPEARRAIKKMKVKNLYGEDPNGIKVVVGQIVDIEFWDKLKGIELLGSEKNVFKKTTVVQHDVTANMKDVLLESGNRAEERLRLMAAREVGGGDLEGEASDSQEGWSGDGIPIGE